MLLQRKSKIFSGMLMLAFALFMAVSACSNFTGNKTITAAKG